ncbi:hypothetical protein EJB05_03719 [Eragrostis curvula]|uniref:Uncharacterized protein n=1 Tax=Eragrostis curvula TaxID=38414 RepID=A0A5J9W8H9_9POAL|nr:hypothetical protein EJB05_03719 [Eragrostis curvula]
MAMRSLIGMMKALPRRAAASVAAAVKDKKESVTSEGLFEPTRFWSDDEPIHVTRAKFQEKRKRDWEEFEKRSRAFRRKIWLMVIAGYGSVGYLTLSIIRSVAES